MKNFNLADWALRHKSIIYYFIAVLLTFGIFSFTHMGRMEDPDFTMRTMVVGVSWPGASPQEMSDQVTDKLEERLRDLPGVDYTKSFTDGSKSVIYINLKEDLPSSKIRPAWEEARNMINDEWKSLPSGVQGPAINDRFDDVYGTIYALSGDEFSYEEKRQQAENLKRQLLSVPNVKKITLIGVQEKSLDITINKDKLASYKVTVQQVLNALKQQSAMVPAGMVNTDTNNVYIRVNGVFDSVDAVKNMPARINNQIVRLGDVADVTMTYKDPSSPQFYYEGKPAIGIAISMDAGANNIEFGEAIDNKLKEFKTTIPAGLNLDQVSNQPHIVKESIGDFSQSLFEAIAIVLLVSFASLGIRTGVVVALTIPVVVSTVFVLMYENGIYLHKVSLGALILSLGLLVDDAIIVVEMMSVKLEEGFNHWRAATFAYESTAFPMLSGTLITCAGFLPLALAEGMVAEFTKSLSIVVFLALVLSWIASVLVSPVLGYKIIENKAEKPESEWTRRDHIMHRLKTIFYARFESLLHWALGHHKAILLGTLVAFILSLLSFPLIKQEFFPSSTRNEIIVSMQFPQSSSIDYTQSQAKLLDALLKDNEHIDHYTTYVGEGSPRFVLTLEPELPRANFMQTIIVTKSLKDRDALFKDLQNQLNDQYPSALINMQFVQIGPPSKYPVMLRVSGPNASEVKTIANDVKAMMQQDKDLQNIAFDWPDTEPVAQVHIDPDKARMLGINSYAVSLHLQSLLTGTKAGEYYEGNQTIPVTFKLGGNENHNLAAL